MSRPFSDSDLDKSHQFSKRLTPQFSKHQQYALKIICESEIRLSPGVLKKKIAQQAGITSKDARQIIRELTDKGEISYTYVFGSTYVELSFLKPVPVTEHFTLTPWLCMTSDQSGKTDIEIIIDPGVSFGSGRHPTTRLCLEALDYIFFKKDLLNPEKKLKAADIGTGSGVLAIAAVKAGIRDCLAIDRDPNAISEAKRNIRLNQLEKEITVTNLELHVKANENFALICANLRVPTLKKLLPLLQDITDKNSLLVLSGIRIWETEDFLHSCSKKGFSCIWRKNEKKWSGLILQGTGTHIR